MAIVLPNGPTHDRSEACWLTYMYGAFLFDMDGVLIDSMPFHIAAFNECLEAYGKEVSHEQISGRSTIQILTEIFGDELSSEDLISLSKNKSQRSRELMIENRHLLLMDGALEVLKEIKKFSPIALCTSASESSVNFILDQVIPTNVFEVVVHSGHVSRAKPDPEIYTKAVEALKIVAENCLVIEDSISGVESGLKAGCPVVLLNQEKIPENLPVGKVQTVQSLRDLLRFVPRD